MAWSVLYECHSVFLGLFPSFVHEYPGLLISFIYECLGLLLALYMNAGSTLQLCRL